MSMGYRASILNKFVKMKQMTYKDFTLIMNEDTYYKLFDYETHNLKFEDAENYFEQMYNCIKCDSKYKTSETYIKDVGLVLMVRKFEDVFNYELDIKADGSIEKKTLFKNIITKYK